MQQRRRFLQPKALTPYQIEILTVPWYGPDGKANTHTFIKARRVGGSEVCALRAGMLAVGREMHKDGTATLREPMDVYVSSKEFKSAKDVIDKVGTNCREMAAAGDPDFASARIQGTRVHFPQTGTSIYAVTRTSIRGSTGGVILDEFPHTPRQKELWGAAGLVSNPTLGNDKGYPKLIVGTPWESGSWAHEVFTSDTFPFRDNRFVIDIYEAVRQGFPIDPETAFAELGIPELIDTEYLCKWSHGGGSFFPPEKLRAQCIDDDVDLSNKEKPREIRALPVNWEQYPCFHGIDVGGGPGVTGTGRDFTAIVQWRVIEDEYWVVGVKAFNHLEFEEQVEEITRYIRRYPGEVRIDGGGGGGQQMLQVLPTRLAGQRNVSIRRASMDRLSQEKFAGKFKRLLEARQLKLYMGDEAGGDQGGVRALMIELARIKATMAGSGHLQLTTPRDPMEGHCDRAWAAMIGLSSTSINSYAVAPVSQSAGGLSSSGYVHEQDFDSRGIDG